MDVIKRATKNGAEILGRGHEIGTLEAGKLADVLIVDGDWCPSPLRGLVIGAIAFQGLRFASPLATIRRRSAAEKQSVLHVRGCWVVDLVLGKS